MRKDVLLALCAGLTAVAAGGGVALASTRSKGDSAKRIPKDSWFSHTVTEGDTLSGLALRYFGDAAKRTSFRDEAGRQISDERPIVDGSKIRVPCIWHVVKPGDDLSKISRLRLGDAVRWRRVYEANKASLPDKDKLQPGQVLAVPSADVSPEPAGQVAVGNLELLGCSPKAW